MTRTAVPFYTRGHAEHVVLKYGEEVYLGVTSDGDWRIRRMRELSPLEVDGLRIKLTSDMQWVDLNDDDREAIRVDMENPPEVVIVAKPRRSRK